MSGSGTASLMEPGSSDADAGTLRGLCLASTPALALASCSAGRRGAHELLVNVEQLGPCTHPLRSTSQGLTSLASARAGTEVQNMRRLHATMHFRSVQYPCRYRRTRQDSPTARETIDSDKANRRHHTIWEAALVPAAYAKLSGHEINASSYRLEVRFLRAVVWARTRANPSAYTTRA
jgi:hypothetical protein